MHINKLIRFIFILIMILTLLNINLWHATFLTTDKPAKPEGPLEASDIVGESLTLKWKAPKDDGGDKITNYIVEKKKVKSALVFHYSITELTIFMNTLKSLCSFILSL